jgi:hypothetical protein
MFPARFSRSLNSARIASTAVVWLNKLHTDTLPMSVSLAATINMSVSFQTPDRSVAPAVVGGHKAAFSHRPRHSQRRIPFHQSVLGPLRCVASKRSLDLSSISLGRDWHRSAEVGLLKTKRLQCVARSAPNRRSHEVRRIPALRDRFGASWHTGQCSAPPA